MNLIRFPAMAVQDFADEVVGSGLLSLRETTDIFLHFTATPKNRPKVAYPTRPRVGLQMQVISGEAMDGLKLGLVNLDVRKYTEH